MPDDNLILLDLPPDDEDKEGAAPAPDLAETLPETAEPIDESIFPDEAHEAQAAAAQDAAQPPLWMLLAGGALLALVAALLLDFRRLRKARVAVEMASSDLAAMRGQLAAAQAGLEKLQAQQAELDAQAGRDSCATLAAYVDADGMRLVPLASVERKSSVSGNLYLPPNGTGGGSGGGCLVLTGRRPDGPLALWLLAGGQATRLAALPAGARHAAVIPPSGRGKLVVASDPDPATPQPSGDARLIGSLD